MWVWSWHDNIDVVDRFGKVNNIMILLPTSLYRKIESIFQLNLIQRCGKIKFLEFWISWESFERIQIVFNKVLFRLFLRRVMFPPQTPSVPSRHRFFCFLPDGHSIGGRSLDLAAVKTPGEKNLLRKILLRLSAWEGLIRSCCCQSDHFVKVRFKRDNLFWESLW